MSDGNFNKNILPYKNYQSGMRAGSAKAMHKAEIVFSLFLKNNEKKFSKEEQEEAKIYFHKAIHK